MQEPNWMYHLVTSPKVSNLGDARSRELETAIRFDKFNQTSLLKFVLLKLMSNENLVKKEK